MKKRLEDYKQSKPEQLTLFELLSPEDKKYSNTIELYDFIPKYVWGKVDRIQGQFLPSLEREFECRGIHYKVRIRPARMDDPTDKEKKEKDHYPGKREELIEDALRKLICEGQGVFLDDQAGVFFTLTKLQEELMNMGHAYSKDEIKDGLCMCNRTGLDVCTDDGNTIVSANIFTTLGLTSRNDWENQADIKCFVRFNPLVTAGIKNKTFRQIDYKTTMQYKSAIARQLHKRISHHYTQASVLEKYQILLSTIIRDFGLTAYERLRDNLRDVKKALDEMSVKEVEVEENGRIIKKEVGIVSSYKIEKRFCPENKRKMVDALITIVTYRNFNSEMKIANAKQLEIKNPSKQESQNKKPQYSTELTGWSSISSILPKVIPKK
jgi:hypothetical protein